MIMKKSSSILISGSLAYDYIMDFPGVFSDHILPQKLHTLSVSFLVETVERHFGGTAGNIAYSLSLLGKSSTIVSQLGNDGDEYRQRLRSLGIDTRSIQRSHAKTATAWVMTDKKDNQIAAFHPGAMKEPAHTLAPWKKKTYSFVIASPGNSQDRLGVVQWCRKQKMRWFFDPGQGLTDMSKGEILQALTGSCGTFVNDYELALLLKRLGCSKRECLKMTKHLTITLGEKGSTIETRSGEVYHIPAIKPKRVVDPTGAGDAYRAGFLSALSDGAGFEDAGRLGARVASRAIEKVGTQVHTF